jgi:hypothetical protein
MYASPEPVLLADRARPAKHATPCALCPWPIQPGERIADLADSGGAIHVSCASSAASL